MNEKALRLSSLSKTWIFDLDGTLVAHNGYLNGEDVFLPGAKAFFDSIHSADYIIILTSRKAEQKELTETFLKKNGVRYNAILFDMPQGERILFNDSKPSGLKMAHAVAVRRDQGLEGVEVVIDETL